MSLTRPFVVVGRSRASAVFKRDAEFTFQYQFESLPLARIKFRTRYLSAGFEHLVPEDLWVEIQCSATSIEEAIQIYANGAREIASLIGLSMNAYMGNIEVHLAYETTEEIDERDFFQCFLPDMPVTVIPGRTIDIGAVQALLRCIIESSDRDRIMRAIAQYHAALENWTLGSEVPVVANLFMAVENLKTAALRNELANRGISRDALAAEWGFDKTRRLTVAAFLDEQARVRLVFHGDTDTHREAKNISDEFEHGTKNFGLLRPRAVVIMEKAAKHVRNAIIEVCRVGGDAASTMLKEPYSRPRGRLQLVKYFRGKLIGSPRNFAAPGQAYPAITWKYRIRNVTVDADGKYGFSPEESFTPSFGKGVEIRPTSIEVWDGSTLSPQSPSRVATQAPRVTIRKSRLRSFCKRIRRVFPWLFR